MFFTTALQQEGFRTILMHSSPVKTLGYIQFKCRNK